MSKCVHVVRGDGVVVEAAVEGPKKAEHVVGAARGSRGGIDASRRAAAPARPASVGPPLQTYPSGRPATSVG